MINEDKYADLSAIVRSNAENIRKITFSISRSPEYVKIEARPVLLKGERFFKFDYFGRDNKVTVKNVAMSALADEVCALALSEFGQTTIMTGGGDCTVLLSKKGRATVIDRIKSSVPAEASGHDRKKQYIIDAQENKDFLCALGVCDKDGRIFDKKRAKFRQINRFVELLDDIYGDLPVEGTLTVCDLCCGKSYLTFAVYHYLTVVKGRDVRMYGVDLKPDVIAYCSEVANGLNFDKLKFICMDINEFKTEGRIDLVVSLHACDTATDAVLAYAVRNGAGAILSTPCCHHELFHTMKSGELGFIEKHSILKQKFCDAATDSLRALLLEASGYRVEALELIDPEETPKNVMLRAIKSKKIMPGNKREAALAEYERAKELLGVQPTLGKLLSIQ